MELIALLGQQPMGPCLDLDAALQWRVPGDCGMVLGRVALSPESWQLNGSQQKSPYINGQLATLEPNLKLFG